MIWTDRRVLIFLINYIKGSDLRCFIIKKMKWVLIMDEVLRQEHKYLLSIDQAWRVEKRVESIITGDVHNSINGYLVRSLYFDTPDERDYNQKMDSIECRRKIRLRIYSPDDLYAKLELKHKQGINQKKKSLKITKADACSLINGETKVLLKYNTDFAAEMYSLMNLFAYRPKVVIDYRRRAYICKENNIRITFDSSICSTETNFDLFNRKLITLPVLAGDKQIMEVKYNHFLFSYIKDALNIVGKSPTTFSKYTLSRQFTLGYNP